MQTTFIWGTGNVADKMMNNCSEIAKYIILGFIDNNKNKVGKIFHGLEIFSPEILKKIIPDKIVILVDSESEILLQIETQYPEMKNRVENKWFFYKESILRRYKNNTDREIKEIVERIKHKGLGVFNYDFCEKYKNLQVQVCWDSDANLFYVIHCGKRLYFSAKYNTEETVCEYYRNILLEQDKASPHRYLSDEFNVKEGDIVIDAGVAEGNFAIEIIDRVSKIYLIEADVEWIEALKFTFREYEDKVVIINVFLSSYDDGEVASLDNLIDEPVNFIKMDIEGNEWEALCGAKKLIEKSPDLKIAACTYHSDFDQELVECVMDKYGITHSTTNGYMWFPWKVRQNYISSRLNRAIVRGTKQIEQES